ncbi:hypothetical protein IGI37_002343 [Enterococcus sp. AZ194]
MKNLSKKYLVLSFVIFLLFMLELFSLGILEPLLFKVTYINYSNSQKGGHWIMAAILWLISSSCVIAYGNQLTEKISYLSYQKLEQKNWIIVGFLLIICKIITFIDWQTLKVIGEFQKKNNLYLFTTQYLYYFIEIFLVLLIVIFAQKAFELWQGKTSTTPFGGLFLALTWGAFHFISTGGDLWNGFSCMVFSIICGFAYLYLIRNIPLFYLFLCVGYLL